MLQESNEKIYLKCLLTYMICVNIIKHGLFNTIETMIVVGMCFLVQWQKGNVISPFRTFKFKSVLNSVSTTCTCNTNSGTSCSPSSYLSGGIEPHSLSSSNTNLASVSRLDGRVIYLPQRAGISSQRSQRVNSTGKEYCESTGKYSNGRKILGMGSQTHQNLLSSSRVITNKTVHRSWPW